MILRYWNKRNNNDTMQHECLSLKSTTESRNRNNNETASTRRTKEMRYASRLTVLFLICMTGVTYFMEEEYFSSNYVTMIVDDGIHRSLCVSGAMRRRMQIGDRFLCDTHTVLDEEPFALSYPQELYYSDEHTKRPEGNIAFVVTIPSCPEDSTAETGRDDAGFSFYDAAAVLKQSVCNCTQLNNDENEEDLPSLPKSKYNSTLYAVIHPGAISCRGPIDGLDAQYLGLPQQDYSYDRVAVLEELGYWVVIWKEPLYLHEIEDEYLHDEIQNNTGIRDLLHLHAYNLTKHPVAVMMDFDTVFKEPIDNLIDELLNDPTKKSLYTKKEDGIVNTGMLLVKPEKKELKSIIDTFRSTPYDTDLGWDKSGFKGMGVDGFLTYYYEFLNSNANTEMSLIASSDETAVVSFASKETCGKPWECHYDESWDEETINVCRTMNEAWFAYRKDFEEHWTKEHLVDTSLQNYHRDFFLGYCKSEGVEGYPRASDHRNAPTTAPTPYPCDADTQTSSTEGRLSYDNNKHSQDQELTLTTPRRARDFNGQSQYCVSGSVMDLSFVPPFNILFVLDISGSTRSRFQGTRSGRVSDIGIDNTVLESEVMGCLKMLEFIAKSDNLSNDNVNIGVVTFSTTATYHGMFPPLDLANPGEVNPAITTLLNGLNGEGWTNFDGALDRAIQYFAEAPSGRNNIMYFLSDGIPNVSGDHDGEVQQMTSPSNNNHISTITFDWELARLDEFGVQRHAIGVGSESDTRIGFGLWKIDNTPDPQYGTGPTQVMSREALVDAIMTNSVVGDIVHFTVKANGVPNYDIGPDDLIPGPTGYSYTDLTVPNLNTTAGAINTIRVELIMDYDGNINTQDDQNIMVVENVIPGAVPSVFFPKDGDERSLQGRSVRSV